MEEDLEYMNNLGTDYQFNYDPYEEKDDLEYINNIEKDIFNTKC